MFKYTPRLRDVGNMDPAYRVNHKLTGEGMGLSEYERLRLHTRLKEAESAVATEVILSKVMENLSDEEIQAMRQAKKASDAYQKALERAQALEEFLRDHPDQANVETEWRKAGKPQTHGDKLEEYQGWADQAQKSLQQAAQGLDQVLNNPSLRPALRQGMEEATEDLDAFEQFCLSWGSEAGELQRLPPDEKMALMAQLIGNPKLRRLAEMVGRMKRLALSKRATRITMVPEEVVDVTQGNNPARILSSELMLLEDPDRDVLFYKRFVDRELLEYELKGKEKLAKGPIVCCIDNSGSMKGDRELWSKAVALALAEVARKDRRRFHVVHFGGPSDPLKTFSLLPIERGKERLEKMLAIATYFLGGGTDFEDPLTEAAALVKDDPKADVVFITDGGARLSPGFQDAYRKVKKDYDFRIFTVVIMGTEKTLEAVSDETFHLVDLVRQGDGVAAKVFEGV